MPAAVDDDDLSRLQETLASDPENPSHHFNLGVLLWKKGEESAGEESKRFRERSAEHFVASAKLNPSDGASFRFLGHYYSRVSVDFQRAAKCYQRAVNLNPEDFEAGEGLCDLLDGSGKRSLEIAACKEASEKSPRAYWAFRRLGYLQVFQRKWSEAVQNLQHAIRGYPGCADLWEALGLSYQRLGMFTAAIKSYGRAIELEDSRVFALVESGNILLMIGSFQRGVEQFRNALMKAPRNESAHFGLASGLLGLSKECISSGAFGWGAALLEEASEVAKAGMCLRGNTYSGWKLLGDIKISYAKCYTWEDKSHLEINETNFEASINDWRETCLLAAKDAKSSYQRALHLAPWQSNIYMDIAIALDLIDSLEVGTRQEPDVWQLPERMSIGSLMLEGVNNEFWAVLGCLSKDSVLKQHTLIRGLQLDASLAIAWACLGKLYRELDEKHLARQAFDRARSIDPSLALPWAGMAADPEEGKFSASEAYESCLRAVQIFPLAEFQTGLAKLAAVSGHMLSPQVFGAIRQAVQRSPHYPESHNLNGLVSEARSDYQSAITAYRWAQCALKISGNSQDAISSCSADISINLARALCQAGYTSDAARECENLEKDGLLDRNGLQIYAIALWKLGKKDLALSAVKNLAKIVSTLKGRCAIAAVRLLCSLKYWNSGQHSAITFIQKLPTEFSQSTQLNLMFSAINALDPNRQLQALLQSNLRNFASNKVITELHSIICMSKMIGHGSKQNIDICSGVDYLKKVLHMYPDSNLIRNHLGSLLLASGEWMASHRATRCTAAPTSIPFNVGLQLQWRVHGVAGVACYAGSATTQKFSFPTCKEQPKHGSLAKHQLQKWLHHEPWNLEARCLLILNVLQEAREKKFPQDLCVTLKRLVFTVLSRDPFDNGIIKHLRFLILLTASEISLQSGDYLDCISYANNALQIPPCDPFFVHLQLCRAYAVQEDIQNVKNEYMNCLRVKTVDQVGWLSLKYLESKFQLQKGSDGVDIHFQRCSSGEPNSWNMWAAVFNLVRGQCYIWEQDFVSAEQAVAHACSLGDPNSCILLCHGAICMELARQGAGSEFLSRAVVSLKKAQEISPAPVPIVSALLAQAEASSGSRANWSRNIRSEWFSWPAETRPAELYFQMHLLGKLSSAGSSPEKCVELSQAPLTWLLRAIHLNPSCLRYWKALHKLSSS